MPLIKTKKEIEFASRSQVLSRKLQVKWLPAIDGSTPLTVSHHRRQHTPHRHQAIDGSTPLTVSHHPRQRTTHRPRPGKGGSVCVVRGSPTANPQSKRRNMN